MLARSEDDFNSSLFYAASSFQLLYEVVHTTLLYQVRSFALQNKPENPFQNMTSQKNAYIAKLQVCAMNLLNLWQILTRATITMYVAI